MQAAPEVSVLIVAHNAGAYLRPALASILGQQGVALEVVVVDNASTDGSVEELLAGPLDPRVRVLRLKQNRLHAGGLNAGLPLCRGEFVAMMDADDLSLPGRLARQRDELRLRPELDLLGGLAEAIDPAGRVLGPCFAVLRPEDIRAYSTFDMPFPLHAAMGRIDFWRRLGWREACRWAFDLDTIIRAVDCGQVACLPETVYHYRVHATSVSQARARPLLHAASWVRLAAARRRAGGDEAWTIVCRELAVIDRDEWSESELYQRFAERFLSEGFHDLALMYARRAWGRGNRYGAARIFLRALLGGVMRRPARAPALWRLAWLGPAHALRVQSFPPLQPRGWNIFRSQRAKGPALQGEAILG